MVATVWMAFETRKMARASSMALALEAEPYLSLEAVDFEIGRPRDGSGVGPTGTLQVSLRLHNPGKVPVTFSVLNLQVTMPGVKPLGNGGYDNTGGVVFPAQATSFSCPTLECSSPVTAGQSGDVSFEMSYWSVPNDRKKFSGALTFRVKSTDPPYITWTWKGWPTYA